MKLLFGRPIAEKIYQEIDLERKKSRLKPGLTVIMIGKNRASKIYVKLKEKIAEQLGFYFQKYLLPTKTSEKKVSKIINKLNRDKEIQGIIVQLPLPKYLDPNKIIPRILPEKDIDGFHPETKFISPVYQAILKLLSFYKIKIKNKKIVILANSLTFAQPLKKIFQKRKSQTKIVFRSKYSHCSREYGKYLKKADILIIALGQPKFLKGKMIKKRAAIIDVGYSRIGKKAIGDVDLNSCQKKALAISPVPGGIGPLTVAFLMKNVLLAAKKYPR